MGRFNDYRKVSLREMLKWELSRVGLKRVRSATGPIKVNTRLDRDIVSSI